MNIVRSGSGNYVENASDKAACFALARELVDGLDVVARFTIDGEPVPKGRARHTQRRGKVHTYTPERTKDAQEMAGWLFKQAAPSHRSDGESSFGVFALFFLGDQQRRDVDNLLKLVLDGLTGVAWEDDEQVIEVSAKKQPTHHIPEHARTEVLVYRIGRMERRTRSCAYCGKPLTAYPSQDHTRKFCNRECGHAYRRKQNERPCPVCGENFYATSDRKQTYCSRACKSRSVAVNVTCAECGKGFTKPKSSVRSGNSYCSAQCQADFARKRRTRRAKGTCRDCGGPTSKKSYERCRACMIEARQRADLDGWGRPRT